MTRVRVSTTPRRPEDFQQGLTREELVRICTRVLPGEDVQAATELTLGTYNTTYRLDLHDRSVALRVSPAPGRGGQDGLGLRNEYAVAPFLVGLGTLVPTVLAADFTHQLIGRDYLLQSWLPGQPAPDVLPRYPRAQWAALYRQLGTLTRRIHELRGPGFGPVADPRFGSWSEALLDLIERDAQTFQTLGLDADQVRQIGGVVERERDDFDAVEPRLLHGDLWHVNLLLDPDAHQPTITGICDSDRASWGDRWSDWTLGMIRQRPGTERDAFWETYGTQADGPQVRRRVLVYRARNLMGSRIDIARRGLDLAQIPPVHWDLDPVIRALCS